MWGFGDVAAGHAMAWFNHGFFVFRAIFYPTIPDLFGDQKSIA